MPFDHFSSTEVGSKRKDLMWFRENGVLNRVSIGASSRRFACSKIHVEAE